MIYDAILFDLDGTLLESLVDIKNALNKSLEECNYSIRYDYEGTKKLIGKGVYVLIDRAVTPLNLSNEEHDKFTQVMLKNYKIEQGVQTKPFPNEKKTLTKLKELGYKLFVVTNKPQFLVDQIIAKTYGSDFFNECIGQSENSLPKPNPQIINLIKDKYHFEKSKMLFVGDSKVDIETAHNGGIDCMLVTFGYDEYTSELTSKVKYIANKVEDIYTLLK